MINEKKDVDTDIPLVILAGGLGTRMGNLTQDIPKPMLEINGLPIIFHIMAHYAKYGVRQFHILAGYKSAYIKDYFSRLAFNVSSVSFTYSKSGDTSVECLQDSWGVSDWCVSVHETGFNSETGERLRRIKNRLPKEFYFTYGDGLSDFDPTQGLVRLRQSGAVAVLCAITKKERFGNLVLSDEGSVIEFQEKNSNQDTWINGGYMCISDSIFDYINGSNDSFEAHVLPRISDANKLCAVKHGGFWKALDHEREIAEMNIELSNYG
tara:strand:+ start:42 stop:839 length:798 start_codon:yes stop_codon:yes gene_type:complete